MPDITLNEIIIKLIEVGVISIIIWGIFSVKVSKIKKKPDVVNHGCRVCNLDVYTHFNPENKMSTPYCPYLSKENFVDCLFPVRGEEGEDKQKQKDIKRLNKNRCYLALCADEANRK